MGFFIRSECVLGSQTIPCVTFICHPFLPSIIWIIGASLLVYLVDVVPLVLYKPIKSKWLYSFGLSKTITMVYRSSFMKDVNRLADEPMWYIRLPPIFAIHYMDNWGLSSSILGWCSPPCIVSADKVKMIV